MPKTRRPFRSSGRGKKLDHTNWQLSTGSAQALVAGTAAVNFSVSGLQPSTLLRIRGEVLASLDGQSSAGKALLLSYGVILVPEGTGSTVVFDPFLDANAPWLLYGSGHLGYEEPVIDVINIPGITSFRHVIDNKAMRIIRPDMEMQFVVTSTTVGVMEESNVYYSFRWLQGF